MHDETHAPPPILNPDGSPPTDHQTRRLVVDAWIVAMMVGAVVFLAGYTVGLANGLAADRPPPAPIVLPTSSGGR